MKSPIRRNTILAAVTSAVVTFVVVAALRPIPRTRFVAADGSMLPDPPFNRIIQELRIESRTLPEALAEIGELAKTDIHHDSDELEKFVDCQAPLTLTLHDVTLATALQKVFDKASNGHELGFWQTDDGIQIGTKEQALDASVITRVLDVRDSLGLIKRALSLRDIYQVHDEPLGPFSAPGHFFGDDPSKITDPEAMEGLLNLVEETVDTESWKDNGGTVGSIRSFGPALIITHTPKNLDAIEQLLDQMVTSDVLNPLPPGAHISPGKRVQR